jgi:O-antigen/teichoic acid export membrane protein
MTITYVNSTQYGIWLTLSSIVGWVSYFDFGLGNGLRNKFAESKAKGETGLARQYVSTAYMLMILIAGGLFILIETANCFLDWTTILHVNSSYYEELRAVFAVLIVFFCLNIVVTLFANILRADQKPDIAVWWKSTLMPYRLLQTESYYKSWNC